MTTAEALSERRELSGWGLRSPSVGYVVRTRDLDAIGQCLRNSGQRGVIARGLGRSYGDPAQNGGGLVIDMTCHDRLVSFDYDTGIVEAEAGVTLDALLRRFLPQGFWVPVLPGTRQVTLGGAVASDIHGKNHHSAGSFGNHVVSLDLMLADGSIETLSPSGTHADLFWATVGGMGLTGIVLRVKLRLVRTESAYFLVDRHRTQNLSETIEHLTDGSDNEYAYSVAVPDTISTGTSLGRACFSRGSLASLDQLPHRLQRDPLKFNPRQLFVFPRNFPVGVVKNFNIKIASEGVYRTCPKRKSGVIQDLTTFYHPLDLIGNWNRAYGRKGFFQYQFSVPFGAEVALASVVRRIAESGHRSFLNVFKRMGDSSKAPLSWPHPGLMLSLDFLPRDGLGPFLDSLDEDVVQAGGRLYFAKDSRMKPELIPLMYPRLDEWRTVRQLADPEGVFVSDLARRLKLLA